MEEIAVPIDVDEPAAAAAAQAQHAAKEVAAVASDDDGQRPSLEGALDLSRQFQVECPQPRAVADARPRLRIGRVARPDEAEMPCRAARTSRALPPRGQRALATCRARRRAWAVAAPDCWERRSDRACARTTLLE